jgi:enamine deaminase RidA (YjgF/YER057c/UK114 family)
VRIISSCWIITGGSGTFPNSGKDLSVVSGSIPSVSSPAIYSVVAVRRIANQNRKTSLRRCRSSVGCVLSVGEMLTASTPTHSNEHVFPSKFVSLLNPRISTHQPVFHTLKNVFVDVVVHVLDCCRHVHDCIWRRFFELLNSAIHP